MEHQTALDLKKMACKVPMGVIEGVHAAKAGHPGGSLSAADLFTYLYFKELNIDPANPKDPDRDRFVLSKGQMLSTDIFIGLPFNENTDSLSDTEKETAFREYIVGMDGSEKAAVYIQIMSISTKEQLNASVSQTMASPLHRLCRDHNVLRHNNHQCRKALRCKTFRRLMGRFFKSRNRR